MQADRCRFPNEKLGPRYSCGRQGMCNFRFVPLHLTARLSPQAAASQAFLRSSDVGPIGDRLFGCAGAVCAQRTASGPGSADLCRGHGSLFGRVALRHGFGFGDGSGRRDGPPSGRGPEGCRTRRTRAPAAGHERFTDDSSGRPPVHASRKRLCLLSTTDLLASRKR